MTHWIYSALVGLVVGWVARFVLPGNDSMGILMTMLVGVVGAYVGTAIGALHWYARKERRGRLAVVDSWIGACPPRHPAALACDILTVVDLTLRSGAIALEDSRVRYSRYPQ